MRKNKIVTGIGELLWDVLPEGKKIGGAPCNFAFHARQMGCDSFVVSAVGNDPLGNEIRDGLQLLGVSDAYVQSSTAPTGTVSVVLDSQGIPDYTIHEKVAWDDIAWEEELHQLAKKSDAVCFGSLAQRSEKSRTSIHRFLNSVPDKCQKVFDINLRQSFYSAEIIESSLNQATVLKLNDDELKVVASLFSMSGDIETQLSKLMERFELDYLAYTMGSAGSLLMSRSESSFCEAPKVNVVDTVGAGDAFTATLIAGILKDSPLKEIHEKATNIAAFLCTQNGATPIIGSELIQV